MSDSGLKPATRTLEQAKADLAAKHTPKVAMMQPLTLATAPQLARYTERLITFAKRCGKRTDIADHLRRCAQLAAEEENFYDQTPDYRRTA